MAGGDTAAATALVNTPGGLKLIRRGDGLELFLFQIKLFCFWDMCVLRQWYFSLE